MPGSPIAPDTRRIVVQLLTAFEPKHVASLTGISESSVCRIWKIFLDTGDHLPLPDVNKRGRKPILDSDDHEVSCSSSKLLTRLTDFPGNQGDSQQM